MIIRLFIIFLLLQGPARAFAQSRYNFFTIGMEQGLSNPNIWSINQDKYGYIWIATVNGLNRYDGHSMKQYFHSETDKNSVAGNATFWIFKDSDGEMWFACGFDGLSKYNYAEDKFESLAPYDSARLKNEYRAPVWRFGEDAQKRIYLSCGGAFYRYNKKNKHFEDLTYLLPAGWNVGIGRFFLLNDSTMWMPTDLGLYRYDLRANKLRKMAFDHEKLGFGSEGMYDAELINDHELLLSMQRAGYVIFDLKTETFRPADDPYNPAHSGKFTEMGEVLKDSRNRYWMANSSYGLIRYYPENGSSVFMKKEPLYPYPYPEQEGQGKTLFEDRDGNIWYGTSTQGAIRFQPDFDFIHLYSRDYAATNSLPDNSVTAFAVSGADRHTWIGTAHRGISYFDPLKNTYTNYSSGINTEDELPGALIRTFVRAGDSLFIASNKGLTLLQQKSKKFLTYGNGTEQAGDKITAIDNNIHTILQPGNGELLLVSSRIGRFFPATQECIYKAATTPDPLYDFKEINAATLDNKNHKLWFETGRSLLYEYDLVTHRATRHHYNTATDTSTSAIMHTMKTDADGKLWIGSSHGIILYDPQTKKADWGFTSFRFSNVVNILTEEDWIWFSTRQEIGRINKRSKQVTLFNIRTLLPNATINARSLVKDADGQLWIGSNAGFCIIDPARFRENTSSQAPQLTGFKVFNASRFWDMPYSEVRNIDLRYSENFFSFSFSAFNFRDNRNTRYAYKLDKFDKDWRYTNETSASYTNVPSGTYTLLIRSANNYGGWNDMPGITIHIQAPFWKTWWFVSVMLLLLALLFTWLWRIRRRRQQQHRLDKTIDYFANSVYGENSVNEICWDIARNCISQLQFEDCVVYLLDEKTNKLIQKAAYGPKNPKGHEIVDPIEIERGRGIVGTVAANGKALLIGDTSKDDRYIVDDEHRYSELAVPILHDGKVIGVIDSENSRKNFYTEDHLKAMITIASISANKIAEAQAEEYAKENEIKLLEIRKMLAESQLMALRAQMNPHFVFNCLNSIQECIVTEKYGEASKYLNKFSKLFRMVLNNSGKNLVTLNEEKEVLALYLELEQMRFEKSFSWQMIMDEELEADEILIPSMLLQPYVENALWHGLMHKDGDRHLLIRFERLDEDVFRCTIDDNGIGRKKSFELKAQQSKSKRHESKGLKISKDRIDLLQKQGYHATLEITDKYTADDVAEGTSIAIELSTFLKM